MGYPYGFGSQKWGTPSALGSQNWGIPSALGSQNWGTPSVPIKKRVAPHRPPPPGAEKVANMAPTWVPKWSQDGPKIDAKMHHFFDASWNRFLDGFWWILNANSELDRKYRPKTLIQKWSPRWNASWDRFFMDFPGCWEAS